MPAKTRRTLLALVGAGGLGTVAGCVRGPSTDSPAASPEDAVTDPTETPTPEPSPTETPSSATTESVLPDRPIRCDGDPMTAVQSVTDEPGWDDDKEYFPRNETVRIVTARSGDEPVAFAEWTFEEWATIETANVAQSRAIEGTEERLGTDDFGSGVGRPPEHAETDALVVWLRLTTRVDDGDVVRTPSIAFADLVSNAPRSVETTVSLDGDSFTRTVPVFAEHSEVGFGGDVGGG